MGKDKLVNGLKQGTEPKGYKSRKGKNENLNVEQQKMAKSIKGKTAKPVKRKIEFGNETEKSNQVNNNATVATMNTRSKDAKDSGNKGSYKVKWTQEILNKIRKSNEKHANKL